jgi:hypothetical protein
MCCAGIIPLIYFAIDDVSGKWDAMEAFNDFLFNKRFMFVAVPTMYAVISAFVTVYGWDVVSSIALLTPFPVFSTFGAGFGIAWVSLLKSGE